MPCYYAIERSNDYLAHYGIKGMKWGVRKALESGNTRALSRQYRKAQKKLERLEARANSNKLIQKANRLDKISKGARIAGRVGLGVTAATTAFSGIPTSHGGGIMGGLGYDAIANHIYSKNAKLKEKIDNGFGGSKDADVVQWRKEQHALRDEQFKKQTGALANADRISRGAQKIGAALGLAGYGVSAAAKLRANALRKRATGEKHKAAVAEANRFRQEMNKTFAGTQFANGEKSKKRRRR